MFRHDRQTPARRRPGTRVLALAGILALTSFSCSDSPSDPTPVSNAPPVIQSVTASAPRVEAEQEVQLTAVVQDAETRSEPADLRLVGFAVTRHPDRHGHKRSVAGAETGNDSRRVHVQADRHRAIHVGRHTADQRSLGNGPGYTTTTRRPRSRTSRRCFSTSSRWTRSAPRSACETSATAAPARLRSYVTSRRFVTCSSARARPCWCRASPSTANAADIRAPCTFRSIRKSTGVLETSTGTCRLTAVYRVVSLVAVRKPLRSGGRLGDRAIWPADGASVSTRSTRSSTT